MSPFFQIIKMKITLLGTLTAFCFINRMLEEQENDGLQEEEDDDPVFVLTDEWREFFAKSEAERKQSKALLPSTFITLLVV